MFNSSLNRQPRSPDNEITSQQISCQLQALDHSQIKGQYLKLTYYSAQFYCATISRLNPSATSFSSQVKHSLSQTRNKSNSGNPLSLSDHRANKLDDKTISSKPHTTYRNNSSKPLYKANNTIQGTIYTVQYKQSLYTTLSQQQQQPLTSAWKVTQIINNMAPTAPSTLALNLG